MTDYKKEALLLKASGINLVYDTRQILRDVNFEIHNITRPGLIQGQVVSLVGRSGIGKTQLFKILAGLIQPTSGTVLIGEEQKPVEAGEVGVIPQNYILFNHRTIYQNLRIGLSNSGKDVTEVDAKTLIEDYARKFDLLEHLKKYPAQLSGGQRQRVSIIQQVLTGNKFILLDEPFSGLDPIMKDKVDELLMQIANLDERNTLIIISHDIINTLALSDTAFILAAEPGKEGATIVDVIDLIELGFAWKPGIKADHKFQDLVQKIKGKM
ncbi:MAG: ATP-binding cassette domain-containing protein [Bacteroidota bacterium]